MRFSGHDNLNGKLVPTRLHCGSKRVNQTPRKKLGLDEWMTDS